MSNGNRTPLLGEMVQNHIAQALEKLRVAQPGRIEAYDAATATAEVQPLLRAPLHRPDGLVEWVMLPKLFKIPVAMPQAGGRRIKLPVSVGDHVLLVFCDFNLGKWKAGAPDPIAPETFGTHQVGDAIAIPCLGNPGIYLGNGAAADDAIELLADGTVHLGAGASHPLIFGDDFSAVGGAFDVFIKAVATAMAAITIGAPAGGTPAGTAILTALTAYQGAVLAKLSGNKTA